ncbi:unnamed protein product [Polarella glacialis]|uniref:Uncharacterized protein n=1 Tax=Polarella glacialis TaxID=89957 RepID=A0A813JSV5_POLGL|nr:unnamed protein product [Polarella glacialis]
MKGNWRRITVQWRRKIKGSIIPNCPRLRHVAVQLRKMKEGQLVQVTVQLLATYIITGTLVSLLAAIDPLMPNQHRVDTGISCWQQLWPTHLFCRCASCDAIQNWKLTKHEEHSTSMCGSRILMLDAWLMFACGPKRFPHKKS